MSNCGEFPTSILFVLAVSHERDRIYTRLQCAWVSEARRQFPLQPAMCSTPQKGSQKRASCCDESDQCSLYITIDYILSYGGMQHSSAEHALPWGMICVCWEQWHTAQEKLKGPQTPPNSRGAKSRHANKHTLIAQKHPKTSIQRIHQHVDLSSYINIYQHISTYINIYQHTSTLDNTDIFLYVSDDLWWFFGVLDSAHFWLRWPGPGQSGQPPLPRRRFSPTSGCWRNSPLPHGEKLQRLLNSLQDQGLWPARRGPMERCGPCS